MNKVFAIIGAGYGDEGKGLATDYFARKLTKHGIPPLVARGNGGCQAGHTVVDGSRRHVFGHVGAGTFADSSTYLAANFIVNPILLSEELLKLRAIDARPIIYASPQCRVSLVYDMALNSLAELARGYERHGSCGMGINETVTRSNAGYGLSLETVKNKISFETAQVLRRIREEWVPERLKQLGITPSTFAQASDLVRQKVKIHSMMFDLDTLEVAGTLSRHANAIIISSGFCLTDQVLIVEGAQGLMLDEQLGQFPHVTRSITGLSSSIAAAYECGKTEIFPVYVTRTYTTRHGAGPLAYEGVKITDKELHDSTNVSNEWQGQLRYAPLNLPLLRTFIQKDLERSQLTGYTFGVAVREPKIFLSCLDQLGEFVSVVSDSGLVTIETCLLAEFIEAGLGWPIGWISSGSTATDVQEIEP